MKLQLKRLGRTSAKGPLIKICKDGGVVRWDKIGDIVECSDVHGYQCLDELSQYVEEIKQSPAEKPPQKKRGRPPRKKVITDGT